MDKTITFVPDILQKKNLIFLSLLLSAIKIVSNRTKFQILKKGNVKVQIDNVRRLIKNKYPYFTVEVFLSIFEAILLQTNKANKNCKQEACKNMQV